MSTLEATVLQKRMILGKERHAGEVLKAQQLEQIDAATLAALQSQHILRLSDHNDQRIGLLEDKISGLDERITELTELVKNLKSPTPAKRGPGRPRKEESI